MTSHATSRSYKPVLPLDAPVPPPIVLNIIWWWIITSFETAHVVNRMSYLLSVIRIMHGRIMIARAPSQFFTCRDRQCWEWPGQRHLHHVDRPLWYLIQRRPYPFVYRPRGTQKDRSVAESLLGCFTISKNNLSNAFGEKRVSLLMKTFSLYR